MKWSFFEMIRLCFHEYYATFFVQSYFTNQYSSIKNKPTHIVSYVILKVLYYIS